MMTDLRTQFSSAPEEQSAEGTGWTAAEAGTNEEDEKWKERETYEEDHFVRLSLTRGDKRMAARLEKQGGGMRFRNEFDVCSLLSHFFPLNLTPCMQSLDSDFASMSQLTSTIDREDSEKYGRGLVGAQNKAAGERIRKGQNVSEMIKRKSRGETTKGQDEFGKKVKRMRRK